MYVLIYIIISFIQTASIAVLICTTMILLYIRDIENITGGPEAYEDSDCYKMVAWLLAAVSIVGIILYPVLRTVHYRYVKSCMNNDVTFGYIVSMYVYMSCMSTYMYLFMYLCGYNNALYCICDCLCTTSLVHTKI